MSVRTHPSRPAIARVVPVVAIACLLTALAGCGIAQRASSSAPSTAPTSPAAAPDTSSAPSSSPTQASSPTRTSSNGAPTIPVPKPSKPGQKPSAPASTGQPHGEGEAPTRPGNTEPQDSGGGDPKPLGTRYDFDNFVVTAGNVETQDGFAYVWVTNCVMSNPDGSQNKVPVSVKPWTLSTGKGVLKPREGGEAGGLRQPLFPYSTAIAPFTCAAGWLEFWLGSNNKMINGIGYQNGVGDSAGWNIHDTGVTLHRATFDHFTVMADATVIRKDEVDVHATVCVTKGPDGSGKTRVSRDPWRLSTSDGVLKPVKGTNQEPPWPQFPDPASVKDNSCVSGWLPFGRLNASVVPSQLQYANSLGDKAAFNFDSTGKKLDNSVSRGGPDH